MFVEIKTKSNFFLNIFCLWVNGSGPKGFQGTGSLSVFGFRVDNLRPETTRLEGSPRGLSVPTRRFVGGPTVQCEAGLGSPRATRYRTLSTKTRERTDGSRESIGSS